MVQVIVTDIVSMRERGKYTAMTAFSWALGIILGVSSLFGHLQTERCRELRYAVMTDIVRITGPSWRGHW